MNRWTNFALVLAVALISLTQRYSYAQENQPHMQAALQHLQAAAEELQRAEHDKGGHRAKALNLTQQAIAHVKEGIDYDRTHMSKGEAKKK
jgi:type VI protein secretion system component VasK